ncbi:hypothetical protein ACOALA_04025 [Alicyclobacillus acidoterrestris]|uniref:hypothetical protein n=1 Tax=Alicyclobacillus acidoterrestris TaxID=1450 RepID=UPI003F52DB1F
MTDNHKVRLSAEQEKELPDAVQRVYAQMHEVFDVMKPTFDMMNSMKPTFDMMNSLSPVLNTMKVMSDLQLNNEIRNTLASLKNIPSWSIPTIDNTSSRSSAFSKEAIEALSEPRRREEQHRKDVLEALRAIQQNTGFLPGMFELIKDSNERQDEIFGIFVEILEITKAKNKQEAASLYRKALDKAGKFTGDVEVVTKLVGWANTVFLMSHHYFGQH